MTARFRSWAVLVIHPGLAPQQFVLVSQRRTASLRWKAGGLRVYPAHARDDAQRETSACSATSARPDRQQAVTSRDFSVHLGQARAASSTGRCPGRTPRHTRKALGSLLDQHAQAIAAVGAVRMQPSR